MTGPAPSRTAAAVIDLPVPDDPRAVELAGSLRTVDNEAFLQAVAVTPLRWHHRSTATLISAPRTARFGAESEPTWSLLLRAVHLSFSAHLPLSLSPDVLWFTVVHEIAVHVRLNADHYAGVFTGTPGQTRDVQVRDDGLLGEDPDWSASIRLVLEPLRETLGAELTDLFVPRFSTTGPDELSSSLAALMSVVSPYYRFEWISLCGIPRIRLEGEAEDWRQLARRVGELASWFDGLRPWFDALRPVLDEIAATAAGGPVDDEFWRSLYKWDSRSGGAYVSGWITVLFAHTQTPAGPEPKTSFRWRRGESFLENAFPSHVCQVPVRWSILGATRELRFLSGVLGIDRDGDYLRPRLAHAVAEALSEGPHPADHLLPEGWTHARLREVTGSRSACAHPTDWTVHLAPQDGWPVEVRPGHVLQIAAYACVRDASDGVWYLGDLEPEGREIVLWQRVGTDLAEALRRI